MHLSPSLDRTLKLRFDCPCSVISTVSNHGEPDTVVEAGWNRKLLPSSVQFLLVLNFAKHCKGGTNVRVAGAGSGAKERYVIKCKALDLHWVPMASQTSEKYDPGGARQGMSSRDLPSKRLLGKGLAGIGYETQWGEVRYARKDFVGVPHDVFRNEANVLIGLKDHQNVVKIHGMTVDKLSCSLVLEYMDDQLSGLLQKRKDQRRRRIPAGTDSGNQSELSRSLPFEMPQALYVMLQIARGMEYLHDRNVSHGDLKTRNVLVSYRNDSELSVKAVKLADFGLVRTKRKSMSYVPRQALMLDMVRWKAPECLDLQLLEATSSLSDSKYSDKECTGSLGVTHSADVYSFALTCFQILTGEEPYRKRNWEELVVDIVSDKLRPTLPASCPQVLRDLLVSCWGENPRQRPTFSDICKKLERMHTVIICYELQWIPKGQWEKDLISDFNSWRPLESGEAISQVSEALKIIEDAAEASISFVMNKHQCTSLASRLKAIGEKLKESGKKSVGSKSLVHGNRMEFRAFDIFLTVLRTAKALLLEYRVFQESIPSVLPKTESRKKFKEIHAELDLLNSLFRFEDFGSEGSETERSAILTGDADKDLKEMFESLHRLAHSDASRQAAFLTILKEVVKVVVSEKSKGLITSNDLRSSLIIEPAGVETEGEVCVPEKMGASSESEYVTALAPEISNSGASSRSEYVTALALEISKSAPPIRGKSCFAHSERVSQTIQRGRRHPRRRRDGNSVRQWSIRGNSIRHKSLVHTKKHMSQHNMKVKSCMWSEGERKSILLVESGIRTELVKSHWSQLWSESDDGQWVQALIDENEEAFKALQSHPTWGTFFRTFGYSFGIHGSSGELEVGAKFAQGAQAEVYEAHITWADPKLNEEDLWNGTRWALKVFKQGTSVRQLLSQLPQRYLQWHVERSESLKLGQPLSERCVSHMLCGTLLADGRFAFVMEREQADLRMVINRNLELKTVHEGGPFSKEVAEEIMYDVALGLYWLHEHEIVHRDVKASNVFVNEVKDGHYECFLGDFEVSVGVVGTGFFRAPEILHATKERKILKVPEVFSKAADIYSYGVTCYEILTGNVPFARHINFEYDLILGGSRPVLPNYVDDWTCELLSRCWQSDPAARPSIGEILNILSTNSAAIRKRAAAEQLSDLAVVKPVDLWSPWDPLE